MFSCLPTLTDVLTHDITFGNMATEIRRREPLFHHRNTTTLATHQHSEKNICLYLSLSKIFPAILPLDSQNKMVNILRTSLNTILSHFPTKELINSPSKSFSYKTSSVALHSKGLKIRSVHHPEDKLQS